MEGTIALGTMIIPIETAWKSGVIGLLTTITLLLAGILHWLMT